MIKSLMSISVILFMSCICSFAIAQKQNGRSTSGRLRTRSPLYKKKGNNHVADLAERIGRIENGLPPIPLGGNKPPLRLTLQKLMEIYKVPGLSIAVIDNFKIAWAKGYGVTESGGTSPVTTQTIFQAGSVSKPVAAVGALSLVEQGKLSLDEDVNLWLKTWKLPENEFTQNQKVTLRRILSHSAGLTVHFFPGYAVNESLPTLPQILDGAKPAITAPVRVDFIPGTKWRYSGGAAVIEQQLMIDVTGLPFPQLMSRLVFDKIGMHNSTFEQPLPPLWERLAATGTRRDGQPVPGKWHIYPEMAAAGLWTTPTDLAKLAIEIALAKKGRSKRVLSRPTALEMLKVQMPRVEELALGNRLQPDQMGLGFFLGSATHADEFGHIGDDEGFQAMLLMYARTGKGVAIMANSENGILLGDYLIENIAKEYHWDYVMPARPRLGAATALLAVANLKGTQAALQTYKEFKHMGSSRYEPDQETLITFGYSLFNSNKLRDAIEVMKLAVEEYPHYWNAYDSLGEMYMHAGDKQSAIRNYEKSIELNPDNHGGIQMLKQIKGQN